MELSTYTLDPTFLRECFSHFPSGVAAVAAEINGHREVLIASSFTVGVSLEPPLVMFAVQNTSKTWPLLRQAERVGISVLASDHTDVCRQLASKDRQGRFDGVETTATDNGAVLIGGSSVMLECAIYAEYPAGDHSVALLEVTALHSDKSIEPLVFHGSRFRQLHTS